MGLKTIALVIGSVLASFVAIAQEYAIKQFTVDDGLPSTHVYEVKQDSKGFYWIATSEGLVRYDGYSIHQIAEGNNPFNRDVWWSHEDSEGKIWGLGHGSRLWHYEKDTFSFVDLSFPEVNEGTVFWRLEQDQHKRHWLLLGKHLYGFKEDDQRHIVVPDLLNLQKPIAHPNIIQSEDGSTYLVTMNPVSVWSFNEDGGLDSQYRYNSHVNHADSAFLYNRQNESNTTIILTSPDSIHLVDQNSMTSFIQGKEEFIDTFPSTHLLAERSHRVVKLRNKYAFILAGKSFVTDQSFNHLPEFDFIANLSINTVYQDHESSIWVSTSDQGLFYITKDA